MSGTAADVVPVPASVRPDPGADLTLPPGPTVGVPAGDDAARRVGTTLAGLLAAVAGAAVPVRDGPGTVTLRTDRPGPGYALDVTPAGATLRAAGAEGLFHGVQTLRQLLPARPAPGPVTLPGGRVEDAPRYPYRAAMLDLARHFFGPDDVRAFLDSCVQLKLNVLHLHLTDDQGWRLEIDGWPRLTAGGGGGGVGGHGPGYLTGRQYADLVRYAAERFVTVVPEVDVPGHVNAALVAYPELGPGGRPVPPRTDMRVGYSTLAVDRPVVHRFVADVLEQLAALTPGEFLHVGGDEARATAPAAYREFWRRTLPRVAALGRRAVGWQELAAAGPPAGTVLQVWRPERAGAAVTRALAAGVELVASPARHTYLDMKYDAATPLGLTWAGPVSVRDAYDWDPADVVPGAAAAVRGVAAPLWSETLRSLADVQAMAFPRLAAVAERGWSGPARDWADFRRRLAGYARHWDAQRVAFTRAPGVDWP